MLPLTPTRLGRYEIVDEIGKGAMGVVYLARDPLIGRLVALKTFRIGYSVKDVEMEQFRARFIREAQSAGILSHPNIVTIHDVVEQSEDGLAFIAMEYVRGTNLKALLQGDQPLTLPFIVEVIAQVADSLDYAHSHRVVHRDVKPANILITADNRVKITDFGIARIDTSNLTQEGQLLGTPNYMAPEQIQGREVDHRADLFALGVVLYEMLTRHKPFQGENLTVVSHRIVYDHFTPPRDYVQNLPPGLEAILARALDKDPNRRYQKAKEMVGDLRRLTGTLAADDLNETQSLSVMAPVVPPPPLGSPLGSSWAQAPDLGTNHGTMATPPSVGLTPPPLPPPSSASAPPQPPSVATHVTRPTAVRKGPLVSPGRTVLTASIAALLLLAVAAALFAWIWSTTPQSGRDAKQDDRQKQVVALVQTGYRFLKAGDPTTAARAFRQAEEIAPENQKPQLRNARMMAEKQAAEFGQLVGRQKLVVEHLVAAQQAMDNKRFEEAIVSADAALALDPGNTNAQEIRTAAQTGQTRLKERQAKQQRDRRTAAAQEEVASNTTAPEPEPLPTTAAEEPVPQTASLHISFQSDMPGATVIVRINGHQILRETVGERGGLLRRREGDRRIDRTFQIAAGDARVEVWVTPPKRVAQHFPRDGNFMGGSSRSLDIHLSEAGKASVNLN